MTTKMIKYAQVQSLKYIDPLALATITEETCTHEELSLAESRAQHLHISIVCHQRCWPMQGVFYTGRKHSEEETKISTAPLTLVILTRFNSPQKNTGLLIYMYNPLDFFHTLIVLN